MVTKYRRIQILDRVGSGILLGATSGVFSWYIKDHNVSNYLISLTSGASMAIALLNLVIKKIDIKVVEKLWFIDNILIFLSLFTMSNPEVFMPLSVLFVGIDHVLYDHVQNHYLDIVKNKLNLRNLNADLSVYRGIAGLVAIPLAMVISQYYSDIVNALTIMSYIILDVIVVILYRRL